MRNEYFPPFLIGKRDMEEEDVKAVLVVGDGLESLHRAILRELERPEELKIVVAEPDPFPLAPSVVA